MQHWIRLAVVAPLAWSGLAHSSSGQGLGVSINLGGLGVGVSVGSPPTPSNPAPGGSIGIGVSLGSTGLGVTVGGSGQATTGTGDSPVVVLGQQAAIDAVNTRRAVPLDVILAKARKAGAGEIVDAQLITYRGFLLYDLKVLASTGDVSELYFYARSGEQVQTN